MAIEVTRLNIYVYGPENCDRLNYVYMRFPLKKCGWHVLGLGLVPKNLWLICFSYQMSSSKSNNQKYLVYYLSCIRSHYSAEFIRIPQIKSIYFLVSLLDKHLLGSEAQTEADVRGLQGAH